MEYCLLDLDDINPTSIISQEIKEENDLKTIITLYLRNDNKKVKRTSVIKTIKKEIKIKKSVMERRRNMKKFGLAINKINNKAVTTFGNKVFIENVKKEKKYKIKMIVKQKEKLLFKNRFKF